MKARNSNAFAECIERRPVRQQKSVVMPDQPKPAASASVSPKPKPVTRPKPKPKPKPAGSDNPDLLLPACKSGDGEQCHTLALKYVRGGGVPKNPEKGFQLMQQGCSHGYAQACFVTSQMWRRGIGTNRSTSKASEYLKKACDLGHQGAIDAGECE